MQRKGLIAGLVGTVGLALVAAVATRREPDADLPEVDHTDRYQIEILQPGGVHQRVPGQKKTKIVYSEDGTWRPIPSLFCFGREGQGGANRMGDDYEEIVRLSGNHFECIDTAEEGFRVIELLRRHVHADFRLVRIHTFKLEVVQ